MPAIEPAAGSAPLAAAEVAPTLGFAADWSVAASGPIVSGGPAIVHYDVARLPDCRAVYHGFPAWGINAYYAVDGGPAFTVPVTQLQNGAVVGVDASFTVPPGQDLALWFHASDEYGCSQWDSAYGANFHFALAAGSPAIHFRWPAFTDDVSAPLAAGGDLLVDYDIRRLPTCRQDYNGAQTWDVLVDYRFDGGATASASLTTALSDYERVQAPARLHVPDDARTIELWFDNHDRTGCQAWDSAYGANYRFDLIR
jgi:hypothetical protein